MIISASRRTDIPAFHARWFMERVREGFVIFEGKNYKKRISLKPQDVDVIVFWTKNPAPLMGYLDELKKFRFYFQFTINGYPKAIEPCVPSLEDSINTFKALSQKIGKEKVIWRFDPIILSNLTDRSYIIERFQFIAQQLRGYTRRAVISFVDCYGKVENRLRASSVRFYEIDKETAFELSREIGLIARANEMEIYSCAEKWDLTEVGVKPGKCIDDGLIKEIFGIDVSHRKDPSQRKACGCVESFDIGQYNTCGNKCLYCYANQ